MLSFFKKIFSLTALGSLAFASPQIQAGDTLTPVPTVGSISTSSGGVIGTQNWGTGGDGFKISWNVSQSGSGYHYIYTITDAAGGSLSKDMSHFLLEISPTITASNLNSAIYDYSPDIDGGPLVFTSTSQGNSNPGLPGELYAIKFDATGDNPIIDFMSSRPPVWGDFYAKSGKTSGIDVIAYNSGIGQDYTSGSSLGWIPRPDTGNSVATPEPGTMILLGSSLAAIAARRKLKKTPETT